MKKEQQDRMIAQVMVSGCDDEEAREALIKAGWNVGIAKKLVDTIRNSRATSARNQRDSEDIWKRANLPESS